MAGEAAVEFVAWVDVEEHGMEQREQKPGNKSRGCK